MPADSTSCGGSPRGPAGCRQAGRAPPRAAARVNGRAQVGRARRRRSRRRRRARASSRLERRAWSLTAASRPASEVGSRPVERDRRLAADHAGTELDRRDVTFADRAGAEDERAARRGQAGLVRMGDDRRVAQRGGFDRVLVGEGGADQQRAAGDGRGLGPEAVATMSKWREKRLVQGHGAVRRTVEEVGQSPATSRRRGRARGR